MQSEAEKEGSGKMNTRRVTKAGGISIPAGMRREMNIRTGDALDVETDAGGGIRLRPHLPRCVFCSGTEGVIRYMGKGICRGCAAAAGKEGKDGKREGAC